MSNTEQSRTKSSSPTRGEEVNKKDANNLESHLTANNFIAPISMAVIDNKSEDPLDIDTKGDVTVDVNWMYEYGKHLFAKYVKNSADLAINTSYNIRSDLRSIYCKETNEEAFQKILLLHHESLSALPNISPKEEQIVLQTYLYHSFDLAFHSVWCLLKSDTFFRFQQTKEYKVLCEQQDARKLEEDRAQRDREYSKSLKDHESTQYFEMSANNQNIDPIEEIREEKKKDSQILSDDLLDGQEEECSTAL